MRVIRQLQGMEGKIDKDVMLEPLKVKEYSHGMEVEID